MTTITINETAHGDDVVTAPVTKDFDVSAADVALIQELVRGTANIIGPAIRQMVKQPVTVAIDITIGEDDGEDAEDADYQDAVDARAHLEDIYNDLKDYFGD